MHGNITYDIISFANKDAIKIEALIISEPSMPLKSNKK